MKIAGIVLKEDPYSIQQGKNGRDFKLLSIKKGKNEKYINRVLKFNWLYIFKYIDDGSMFGLKIDYYGEFTKKLNHEEIIKYLDGEEERRKQLPNHKRVEAGNIA